MSQSYTHKCIKCGTQYTDQDEDAYLCETCTEEKKAIAREVDRKMAGNERDRGMSPLQEYEAAEKVHGRFMKVNA